MDFNVFKLVISWARNGGHSTLNVRKEMKGKDCESSHLFVGICKINDFGHCNNFTSNLHIIVFPCYDEDR